MTLFPNLTFRERERLRRRAARAHAVMQEYRRRALWGVPEELGIDYPQRAFTMREHLQMVMRAERQCYPKQQHDTFGAADAQKRSIEKRNLQRSKRLHVYKCPHCFKYHVGHASHGSR